MGINGTLVEGPFVSRWASQKFYLVPDLHNDKLVWVFVAEGQQRAEGTLFQTKREAHRHIKANGFKSKADFPERESRPY